MSPCAYSAYFACKSRAAFIAFEGSTDAAEIGASLQRTLSDRGIWNDAVVWMSPGSRINDFTFPAFPFCQFWSGDLNMFLQLAKTLQRTSLAKTLLNGENGSRRRSKSSKNQRATLHRFATPHTTSQHITTRHVTTLHIVTERITCTEIITCHDAPHNSQHAISGNCHAKNTWCRT